jgi:prepilin-type N-terminal cleavage/methylation domain-containing protein
MKIAVQSAVSAEEARRGFTLVEVLISAALAGMVLAMVMGIFNYSGTSFAAMGNYSDLDRNSRKAVDLLSKQIRNSSGLSSFSTNASGKFLIFTNATAGTQFSLSYDPSSRVLSYRQTGGHWQTLLTGCDQWDFSLYSKAPKLTPTNITFYAATNDAGQLDPSVCKLVNMTWKCSRNIFGSKRNTETIQTAEIVLRNKVK